MQKTPEDIASKISALWSDYERTWNHKLTPLMPPIYSPDKTTSKKGWEEIDRVFSFWARDHIERDFSSMVRLRTQLANANGQSVIDQSFPSHGAIAKGLEILEREAASAIQPYLTFKANLAQSYVLHPSDIFTTAGDWGATPTWEECKQSALACAQKLGLDEVAATVIDATASADAVKFWQGFEPCLATFPGLLGSRLACHEMGHAVHFDLAGTTSIRDPNLMEIVSMFQEALWFREMEKQAISPQKKMALLSDQLNCDIKTLEQFGHLQFEKNAYRYAAEHPDGTIPVMTLWKEANRTTFGDAFSYSDGSSSLDSSLMTWNHYMLCPPGYGSGYLVGWAAAAKLMEKLDENPEAFKETYRTLLAKGNGISAEDFLHAFGIDPLQPDMWQGRIQQMREQTQVLQDMHKQSLGHEFVNPAQERSRGHVSNVHE